jgi:hypothetical protein
MAQKKAWVTWMPAAEAPYNPAQILQQLGRYGLEVVGNTWVDDLERMAWLGLRTTLLDTAAADLWLIAGDQQNLSAPSNRYALSLLTASVCESRGTVFPIICLGLDFVPDPATLPTLMHTCQCLAATEQGWPAKVVAAAFSPRKAAQLEMRLGVHAAPMFGQWFEVGPRTEHWAGVMFGVATGGTITHHAVGPRGQLPERAILEYQLQGLQAQVGETLYTAWSVQNRLSPEDSYYVRVEGFPSRIVVGGHPGTDQAEVFVMALK